MPVTSFCTRFVGLFFATSALLVVSSCGGGGGNGGGNGGGGPLPAQLSSINVSQSTLTLDRWGDSVTISAQAVDQNGANVSGATITWSTPDANIASVDNTGKITSWMAGTVDLTVEASASGTTVTEMIAVTVTVQQNANCQVPTEFPVKGPVAPPVNWDVQNVNTSFAKFPAWSITLDVDDDGDQDLIIDYTEQFTPWVFPASETHVWLNDGSGVFTDGTAAVMGGF